VPLNPPAPEISIVVPVYNERANVEPLVQRLSAALSGTAFEIVFVDDASPDGTGARCATWRAPTHAAG
jgi:dolichol-phosphate mannosyltransferase